MRCGETMKKIIVALFVCAFINVVVDGTGRSINPGELFLPPVQASHLESIKQAITEARDVALHAEQLCRDGVWSVEELSGRVNKLLQQFVAHLTVLKNDFSDASVILKALQSPEEHELQEASGTLPRLAHYAEKIDNMFAAAACQAIASAFKQAREQAYNVACIELENVPNNKKKKQVDYAIQQFSTCVKQHLQEHRLQLFIPNQIKQKIEQSLLFEDAAARSHDGRLSSFFENFEKIIGECAAQRQALQPQEKESVAFNIQGNDPRACTPPNKKASNKNNRKIAPSHVASKAQKPISMDYLSYKVRAFLDEVRRTTNQACKKAIYDWVQQTECPINHRERELLIVDSVWDIVKQHGFGNSRPLFKLYVACKPEIIREDDATELFKLKTKIARMKQENRNKPHSTTCSTCPLLLSVLMVAGVAYVVATQDVPLCELLGQLCEQGDVVCDSLEWLGLTQALQNMGLGDSIDGLSQFFNASCHC